MLKNYQKKLNPLSANPTKWSNKLKQFVRKLPTNCLSVFDHSVGLTIKGLKILRIEHHKIFKVHLTNFQHYE